MTNNPRWIDMQQKIMQFNYHAPQPLKKGTPESAAYDLMFNPNYPGYKQIPPGETVALSTGVFLELPQGYMGLVLSRSGLALKNGIVILNAPGLIDSDYRGEIKLILINHGNATFRAEPGMRLAQLLIMPIATVLPMHTNEPLNETGRGAGGLGSTGV